MTRKKWATVSQEEWFRARQSRFADAKIDGTTRAFFNTTMELFTEKWPLQPLTTAEIRAADGSVEVAAEKQRKAMCKVSPLITDFPCGNVVDIPPAAHRVVVSEPRATELIRWQLRRQNIQALAPPRPPTQEATASHAASSVHAPL
ncbi:uncharacterized protein BXZ73DRAFT_56703 [Epithele typhae]|uniref:uncharacterized protein n=1 Tax=Epithele typhae TaxID=378194 RepID=UPI00200887DB|nr:uncharacterized protein BXZ73DRAFT_56703 [Epithele typhae]KAH9911959.1 hypothetical protein BXZ73DRAFT_56703 [Epithele typhae]